MKAEVLVTKRARFKYSSKIYVQGLKVEVRIARHKCIMCGHENVSEDFGIASVHQSWVPRVAAGKA